MILDQQATIPAPVDRVWDFMIDMARVSRCVPGVESFDAVAPDTYEGVLRVKVGPIALRFQGRVEVAGRDEAARSTRFEISAAENRMASTLHASAVFTLVPQGTVETEIRVHTEASVFGRLGEFGEALMRRQAQQVVAEFSANVARELTASGASPEAP